MFQDHVGPRILILILATAIFKTRCASALTPVPGWLAPLDSRTFPGSQSGTVKRWTRHGSGGHKSLCRHSIDEYRTRSHLTTISQIFVHSDLRHDHPDWLAGHQHLLKQACFSPMPYAYLCFHQFHQR
ncbi:hypothetical protein C8J56DRAFT_485590 [Mycena floridula]|nr:hypothetical protein C8J56DRAFT_485590 [Mycena floridula]